MRIAFGGISHETNTFCRGETTVAEFKLRSYGFGQDLVEANKGVRSYIGGILDSSEQLGIEAVPTFHTSAQPSATINRRAYEELRESLLGALREAGEVDGVLLALHGAGVADGYDDIEGDIIQHVREQYGDEMPIVVTLDLHGNITQKMVDHADAMLGVNLYPHTDSYDRGVEGVELLQKLIAGEVQPVMHLEILPMMIPSTTTDLSPARDINEMCWELESNPALIDCTFFHGFAPADIPKVGISVLAIADGDEALARESAKRVADEIWNRREDFRVYPNPPAQAFEQAMAIGGRPVVINEKADNPGGGGPGDGTHLLRAMLDAGLEEATFGFIYDPETVEQAHAAGVGQTITVRLGGKTEPLHGEPIETEAYVKSLTDGQFIRLSPMGRGGRVNLGRMARLVIGGVDVLVSSVRTQTLDSEVFLLHGIDVMRYKVVAIKSSNHFRAGFAPIAAGIIRADTPGLVSADLTTFDYQRLQRPIWPLDEGVTC